MDSLIKLQRRKAELKAQIEQERNDLKKTFLEIREEIKPANLLKKAVSGALGFSKKKTGEESSSVLSQLPAPLSFVVDLLVRDPKWALGLKLLTPVAIKFWPKFGKSKKPSLKENLENAPEKSVKVKIYSRLRQGISTLRNKLRKAEKTPETVTQKPEN
ncbi:MAG: hypothetical protein H7246_05755 [Phycisphaerae bacterium]|nr:hypothetical protein [Saprospiraceae bacterium]